MSKNHVKELEDVHEKYRSYISKCEDLEEKLKLSLQDQKVAVENESKYRKENVRLRMILDGIQKENRRVKHDK